MPNINASQILRFEDGGEIIIREQGGATDLVVLHVVEGTLRIVPPGRASLPHDTDRGVLLTGRRRGNQQPGSVDFDVKWTGDITADDLLDLLTDEGDLDDGYLPPYEIEVNIYNGPNQNGGRQLLFEYCTRNELPTISAGSEHDTMTARFGCTAMTPSAIAAV